MKMQLRFKLAGVLAAVIAPLILPLIFSQTAFAGGFEKPIYEGAQSAGYAGIGAPSVTGADALMFNPASLVNAKVGSQLSLNLSPTVSKFSAPIDWNNDVANSTTSLNMPFSFIYDYTLNDTWAFAIGGYTAAGGHTYYDNVTMDTAGDQANASADFAMNELSVGATYKLNEQWSFGAAYRMMSTMASFVLPQPYPLGGNNYGVSDLGVGAANGWDANGFRLGATYKPAAKTNIALVYRSEMALHASGNFIGGASINGTPTSAAQTGATIRTTLPQQVTVAAQQEYENWKALAQLEWTNYGRVDILHIDGSTAVQTQSGAVAITPGGINLRWQDQYAVRLGAEYGGWSWPLRFGYAWTSAAAQQNYALAALTPPAATHTLTVGTGHGWVFGEQTLAFNAAVEYDYASGSGDGASAGAPATASGNTTRGGTYTMNDYTAHLGLAWGF